LDEFEEKFEEFFEGKPIAREVNLSRKNLPEGGFDHFQNLEEGRIPTPMPLRVKSGGLEPDVLLIYTANSVNKIDWAKVELLSLGIIREEVIGGKTPKSVVRMRLRQMLLGDDSKNSDKVQAFRDTYLLDIYVRGEESPYRIDSSNVDYRSFLLKCGYSSSKNFRILLKKIAFYSRNSRLDPGIVAYLKRIKENLRIYKTVYDFELDSQKYRINLERLVLREDFELS